jgi:hypothetical protein
MSVAQVEAAFGDNPRPGARPTPERVAGHSVVRPFAPAWANHAEARAWALEALHDVTTVAVDGSQITRSHDFSVPVGAVQVGWFENPHRPEGRYVKDIRFEVLAPPELDQGQEGEGARERTFPDLEVNFRRFELECQVLAEYMRRLADEGRRAVCFFDGSLVISFAARMNPGLQRRYLGAIIDLLGVSAATRVPLVGYVDTSYARDLVAMLGVMDHASETQLLSDGALLRGRMVWGERTEAFICARDDELARKVSPELAYYEQVHLLYLKTTAENAPVRLDLPAWLLEDELLEWTVDVVRAECVVGTGYPYCIETADAVAVITMEDRERFYRTFQEFLAGLGVGMRYSRKAYSKRGRR